MMVIFLTGLVSMILMRTLRNDYAKYAREDDDLETLVIYFFYVVVYSLACRGFFGDKNLQKIGKRKCFFFFNYCPVVVQQSC